MPHHKILTKGKPKSSTHPNSSPSVENKVILKLEKRILKLEKQILELQENKSKNQQNNINTGGDINLQFNRPSHKEPQE